MTTCPCNSGIDMAACCMPYIIGAQNAPTAEALMRSRYTAYATGRVQYIIATSHPDLRPFPEAAAVERWCKAAQFLKLEVKATQGGGPDDAEGSVTFIAWYIEDGKLQGIHERSQFRRQEGKWAYFAGVHPSLKYPAPNDPCPCGSGRKFKKCHGA